MPDAPKPPDLTVAILLASIAVHAEEVSSGHGHPADVSAIQGLLRLPGVQEYIASLRAHALVPLKRDEGRAEPGGEHEHH